MLIRELIERITAAYTIEDVLYMLGKDEEWLFYKIKDELLEHKDDFMTGDEYYTRIDE